MRLAAAAPLLPIIVVLLMCSWHADALIHHLRVKHDTRRQFIIEGFGFETGGTYLLRMEKVKFDTPPSSEVDERQIGFLVQRGNVDTRELDGTSMPTRCEGFVPTFPLVRPAVVVNKTAITYKFEIHHGEADFYTTSFVNCDAAVKAVSFQITLVQFNRAHHLETGRRNYLGIGDQPMPLVYTLMSLVFIAMWVYWISVLLHYKRRPTQGRVFLIHWLMTIVLLLKAISTVLHAIDYWYLRSRGFGGAWGWAYDIFTLLKGVMLFVAIILVGSGWSFVKPFLSQRERRLFMVVVPLQVLANIALVIVDETAPGSIGWLEWHEIFRFVDLLCCFVVLAPVMWSIQQLKESALSDGKAARNLEKLKMFRKFYLLIIIYIYSTRVFMFMLQSLLSFRYTWLPDTLTEVSTFVFFALSGYLFRPVIDNKFLSIQQEDEARVEMEQRLRDDEDGI